MKVYVSKESKKEETKSTAYSFLLVSVFGFIALILFATGVLPVHVADYMKIMLCIVMGVMLLIFFVIGIVSLRQLKTLGTQAEKENDLSSEIISWFTSTYSAKDIDESMDEEVFDQDLYFKRYEIMTRFLKTVPGFRGNLSGSSGGRTLREFIRRKHEIVFFSHCNCATICKIKNEQKDPESIFYRSKNITIHIYEVT